MGWLIRVNALYQYGNPVSLISQVKKETNGSEEQVSSKLNPILIN